MRYLRSFLFFLCFNWGYGLWGFNYSKMANYRFLIDSNTFWMDSGTSKILSKSGPVALPITTKLLKKYKKNMRKCSFSYMFPIFLLCFYCFLLFFAIFLCLARSTQAWNQGRSCLVSKWGIINADSGTR